MFSKAIESAAQYLLDDKFIERTVKMPGSQPIEVLEAALKALVENRPKNFEDCVDAARRSFNELFRDQVNEYFVFSGFRLGL